VVVPKTWGSAELVWTDHFLDVPRDHTHPDGPKLRLYAREVVAAEQRHERLPWLLWLQGGPGAPAVRPLDRSPWLRRMLSEYRVLLMDQRGTGRSTPLTRQTVRGRSVTELGELLTHFRADAVVRDAEAFRRNLVGPDERWTVLGESYGGFCAVTYLSQAPEGLAGVMISGGLPPLLDSPDDVYRATYRRVLRNNEEYWRRHPEDQKVVRAVVEHLRRRDVRLPSGDRLTARRFQTVGFMLGKPDLRDKMHYLLEDVFVGGTGEPELSDFFLREIEAQVSYLEYPLYAVIHESIYCAGTASRWSAERIRQEFPQFDLDRQESVLLTGEMVYPWLFEEDSSLRAFREAAALLAEREDWPRLYDRSRLKNNDVPAAAVIYHDDMYVDSAYSLGAAEAIGRLKVWCTNEYEHDGLWADERVADRLRALLDEAS
jgi:pimeloyl-ACP methyl ester carboxylesterase